MTTTTVSDRPPAEPGPARWWTQPFQPPTQDLQRLATLSERERQVAAALAEGLTNREIAQTHGISVKTIDTHRGHMLKKLGLRNNADVARFAIRVGLVGLGGAS